MGLLRRFDPPAYLPDFEDLPGLTDQWHEAVSGWFDASIDSEKSAIADQDDAKPGVVQFYNPARYDPGGALVEQIIPWNAFPKELLRSLGRDRALAEADQLWPLSRYRPEYDTPTLQRYFYRPQNEYCEWHVTRDVFTGKITRVVFASEPPEFWQALFGDEVDDGTGHYYKFSAGSQDRVLAHYREWVSPNVQLDDLLCTEDMIGKNGDVLGRKGHYNLYNKWNTTHGIVHLAAPPNSLTAEVQLGADGTVLRKDARGKLVVEPDALICCTGYGGPNRNSDPTIGGAVNALARLGAMITLRNPVGLYMDHIDLSAWAAPENRDVRECVRILRGTRDMIERLVVEVPASWGCSVSDLTIAGVPIQFGGQIAECITIKLTGVAAPLAKVKNNPSPCSRRCCIDPNYPIALGRPSPLDTSCPPGMRPAFVDQSEFSPDFVKVAKTAVRQRKGHTPTR